MKTVKGLTSVKQTFNPLYKRKLTDEEAYEIHQNIIGFFELLIKIEKEQKQNNENNN